MPTFTIYVAIKASSPIDESTLDAVGSQLRPEDDEICLWRDEDDASVLRVSIDVEAPDYEAGLEAGRVLADETLRLAGIPAQVDEVVAMTEEGQLQWRPQ